MHTCSQCIKTVICTTAIIQYHILPSCWSHSMLQRILWREQGVPSLAMWEQGVLSLAMWEQGVLCDGVVTRLALHRQRKKHSGRCPEWEEQWECVGRWLQWGRTPLSSPQANRPAVQFFWPTSCTETWLAANCQKSWAMATFEPLEEAKTGVGDVLTELGGTPIFKRRSYGSSSTSCSSSAPSPETEEFESLEKRFHEELSEKLHERKISDCDPSAPRKLSEISLR